MPPSDAELAQALRRCDPSAFDAAFAAYRPRIFGFLVRMVGARDVAEDLLQETFLRLARHAPRLAEDSQIGAWLFTVARNLARSHLRVPSDAARLEEGSGELAAPLTPFDEAAASELGRRLEMALGQLPLGLREAVLLVAVEGLSPAQAAGVLGVTPEALRQRLSRGRALLEDALEPKATPQRRKAP
jgi:RNA polymerase sigma-70 factor (ECF subfamily)